MDEAKEEEEKGCDASAEIPPKSPDHRASGTFAFIQSKPPNCYRGGNRFRGVRVTKRCSVCQRQIRGLRLVQGALESPGFDSHSPKGHFLNHSFTIGVVG